MRKNLKIAEDVHNIIKKYCDDNHLKIGDWATAILLKEIAEKQDVHLPNKKYSKQ